MCSLCLVEIGPELQRVSCSREISGSRLTPWGLFVPTWRDEKLRVTHPNVSLDALGEKRLPGESLLLSCHTLCFRLSLLLLSLTHHPGSSKWKLRQTKISLEARESWAENKKLSTEEQKVKSLFATLLSNPPPVLLHILLRSLGRCASWGGCIMLDVGSDL